MSLRGNNVHWLTPRILSHQSFNSDYSRVYFQVDGTILACYTYENGEPVELPVPTESAVKTVETALRTCVLGTTVTPTLEETDDYSSPYVCVPGIISESLTLMKRAYFSEHTTSDKGLNQKVREAFPTRPEDLEHFKKIIQHIKHD